MSGVGEGGVSVWTRGSGWARARAEEELRGAGEGEVG